MRLTRRHVRGAVVGLALTLGGGVLLAAAPAAAAPTSGPCDTPGAVGIAVAFSHGAPYECEVRGTEITGPGSGATFLKID